MVFVTNFRLEFFLIFNAALQPTCPLKAGQREAKGAKSQAKASLGGPCRLHFRASNAKAGPLENTARADTNAGSGLPRPDTATP